jgi:YHS domain-containing protein
MIQGFNKTIQGLDGGNNKALLQNLDELKDKMYSDNQIVERKPLAPLAPSHRGPQPSFDSQELKRISKIANPFVAASVDASLVVSNPAAPAKATAADDSAPNDNFEKSSPAAVAKKANIEPKIVLNDRFFKDEGPAISAAASKSVTPSETDFAIITTKGFNSDATPKAEVATPASYPQPSAAVAKLLAENPELALHGKCPVTLLKESRWVDGDPKIGCVHRQRTYLFSSAKNLQEFQRDPDAYSPLLAGYDPVIFERSGELVAGEENHGVFMGPAPHQRVVLFSNSETRTEFQANPHKYIETIRQAMQSSGGSSSTLLR